MDESPSRQHCDSTKSLGCLVSSVPETWFLCQSYPALLYSLGGCLVEVCIANMLLQSLDSTIIQVMGLRVP